MVTFTSNININGQTADINAGNGSAAIDGTLSGVISNSSATSAGTLNKGGTGTLALTNTNTYGNATNVNAGTLMVNGSIASSSLTTVADTATLTGSGTVGALTVSTGGTLGAGNSTQSIESLASGALTMASGSTFSYGIANNTSTGADLVGVNGSLTLGGVALSFDLATLAALEGGGWSSSKLTLISYSGSDITSGFTGYADDTEYVFGSNTWLFDYNDTVAGGNFATDAVAGGQTRFVTMTFQPIPEPSAALLGGIGALLLLRRRRI